MNRALLKQKILEALKEKSFKKIILETLEEEVQSLFHVTFLRSVDNVSKKGLLPGSGENFAGYAAHAKGKVFLTEWSGIGFWFWKLEDVAFDSSDDPVHEGYIPVALKIDVSGLQIYNDELGSNDANHDAFFVEGAIPPDRIQLFFEGWKDITKINIKEMYKEAKLAADTEEEDGEVLYHPNYEVFLPS